MVLYHIQNTAPTFQTKPTVITLYCTETGTHRCMSDSKLGQQNASLCYKKVGYSYHFLISNITFVHIHVIGYTNKLYTNI